jgi:zinc protease
MSAFVRTGKASDNQQAAAAALLAALRSGPAATDDFGDTLKYMTADYSVDMHDEWMEITLNVPTEDFEKALQLFADIIRAPAINDASLARARSAAEPADPDLAAESGPAMYEGSLAGAVDRFNEILFTSHPFGVHPAAEDFDELSIEDIETFHADQFVPANMTLAIAGDIDSEAVQTRIVELFGDQPFKAAPLRRDVPSVGAMKLTQHTFPTDKLQSWLVFGHELPVVRLEDQAALEVMNYILAGGHLYTRMTVETRYKYGYTNDASAFLEPGWTGPGSYTFRSYSRHEVIKPIYQNMMAEIVRIREEDVTDEELFIAKGALADGTYQIRYLDGYAIARSFAIERLRYGDHARSADYIARIRAVSKEDVLNAANRYIRPERMQVILVGKPGNLLD